MADSIYLKTNEFSASSLNKPKSSVDSAVSKVQALAYTGSYNSVSGAQYTCNGSTLSLFSGTIDGQISKALNDLSTIQTAVSGLAAILSSGPDGLDETDSSCKNKLSDWWGRFTYSFGDKVSDYISNFSRTMVQFMITPVAPAIVPLFNWLFSSKSSVGGVTTVNGDEYENGECKSLYEMIFGSTSKNGEKNSADVTEKVQANPLETYKDVVDSYDWSNTDVTEEEIEAVIIAAVVAVPEGKSEEEYVAERIQELYKANMIPNIIINDNPDYQHQWRGDNIVPPKENKQGHRSAEAYSEVMEALDVENNIRYQDVYNPYWGFSSTCCNVYVWDVLTAMDCGLPSTNYFGCAAMRDYMASAAGQADGWVEVNQDTAIAMANQGYPTVAADIYGDHVAMVAPQKNGDTGCYISEAGWKNFDYDTINMGWGSNYDKNKEIRYFYHV